MTSFPSLTTRPLATPRLVALIAVLIVSAAWLDGPAQTIALFGVLLVLVDMLVPAGAGPVDADERFERLVRARRLRRTAPLAVLELSSTRQRRELGVETVALDAIAGTVEPAKARQFDREWRPARACAARWKPLWRCYRHGDPVPPVSVYRVDGRYWLCDGHHRVSVLRQLGAATVDADVTEWR